MTEVLVPSKPNSVMLLDFYRHVFETSPRYRTFFYFNNREVRLVLEDFGDGLYRNGEIHVTRLEVARGARGKGLASIAMKALTSGADYFGVHMSLTPAAYDEDHSGLTQAKLEAFYRRYGFRAERGCVSREKGIGKVITGMVRTPK